MDAIWALQLFREYANYQLRIDNKKDNNTTFRIKIAMADISID